MALTVEDGTGLNNADAYVSLAFVDAYHAARGNTHWADYTDAEKEPFVVRATDYIDKRFGPKFRGFRRSSAQALEFPRLDALDDDGYVISTVPIGLQKACAEYALRASLYGVLAPDPLPANPSQSMESGSTTRDTDVVAGEVFRTREKVGPIEEEKWYNSRTRNVLSHPSGGARAIQSGMLNDYNIPEYPEADMWIEPLLKHSSSVTLVRA